MSEDLSALCECGDRNIDHVTYSESDGEHSLATWRPCFKCDCYNLSNNARG